MAHQIIPAAVDVLAVGTALALPDDMTFDQWRDIGIQLGRARTRLNWCIGDWWIFGGHNYGDRRQQAIAWGGPTFQTCEDCGWVARRFEPSRRREALSFTHHREVAGLDPAEADRLLDWCSEGKIRRSTSDLRNEIRRRGLVVPFSRLQAVEHRPIIGPSPPIDVEHRPISLAISRLETESRALFAPRAAEPSPVTLDESIGGGPVPVELAALAEVPVPKLDRMALVRAAFNALSSEQMLEILPELADIAGGQFVLRNRHQAAD